MPSIFSKQNFQNILGVFPKVTGDILIYGIGGSLAQLVGLITLPILTRILSSAELGVVDVVSAASGYFVALITMQIPSGLMRYFYDTSDDAHGDRRKMVSSMVWFTLAFGGVFVFLGSLISPALSQLLFSSEEYALATSLAIASLPLISLKDTLANVLRMQRKPINFLALNIGYAVINFILVLVFVIYFKWDVTGFFVAQLIAAVLIALVSAWECREFLGLTFSKTWFTRMAAYGIPMMPGTLLSWGMLTINRLLLTQYTTQSQIAYYSVATKTAKVVEMAVTAFILGWLPVFLANINSVTFQQKLDKALRYYFYITICLSALVTVFAKQIFHILAPPEYQVGVPLVALLCLRQVFNGTTYTFTVGIVQTKKTIYVSVSTAFGIIATILISLALLPAYGIFGAAIADVAGIFVYVVFTFIFSNALKKLTWNLTPLFWSLLCFILIWLLSINIVFQKPLIDFIYRIGLFGVFLVFVFVVIDRGNLLKIFMSASAKFLAGENASKG